MRLNTRIVERRALFHEYAGVQQRQLPELSRTAVNYPEDGERSVSTRCLRMVSISYSLWKDWSQRSCEPRDTIFAGSGTTMKAHLRG